MNLVLAKTPYHILLAHAARNSPDVLSGDSILVVFDCEEPLVRDLINRKLWWSVKFLSFPTKRISGKSIKTVRRFLIDEGLEHVDSLMTCNDLNWRNQLFMASVKYSRFIVAEDGFGAYVGQKRSAIDWLYAEVYLRWFFGKVTRHYGKMNQSQADLYVSLHGSAFRWFPTSPKKEIFPEFLAYCQEAAEKLRHNWPSINEAEAILLTQPLSDHGHWSLKKELSAYHRLLGSVRDIGSKVIVKKHPAETEEGFSRKLSWLEETFPSIQFTLIRSVCPAEIIALLLPSGSKFLSIASTAAFNVSIARADIAVVCDSSWRRAVYEGWPVSYV